MVFSDNSILPACTLFSNMGDKQTVCTSNKISHFQHPNVKTEDRMLHNIS